MKPADTARLALQSLQRYPLRTGMLLLAIAIGVAAVVMLTAVGEGARRYVTGQFSSLGTNLLIVLPGRSETAGAGLQGMLIGETAREITLDDVIALTRSTRITAVAPVVVGAGSASWRARERDITVLGTSAAMA
jgi:putative ABC transport system permease protein